MEAAYSAENLVPSAKLHGVTTHNTTSKHSQSLKHDNVYEGIN